MINTAVLVLNPKAIFRLDFFASQTDKWVVFPGELRETAQALSAFEELSPAVAEQFHVYAQQHGASAQFLHQLGIHI